MYQGVINTTSYWHHQQVTPSFAESWNHGSLPTRVNWCTGRAWIRCVHHFWHLTLTTRLLPLRACKSFLQNISTISFDKTMRLFCKSILRYSGTCLASMTQSFRVTWTWLDLCPTCTLSHGSWRFSPVSQNLYKKQILCFITYNMPPFRRLLTWQDIPSVGQIPRRPCLATIICWYFDPPSDPKYAAILWIQWLHRTLFRKLSQSRYWKMYPKRHGNVQSDATQHRC